MNDVWYTFIFDFCALLHIFIFYKTSGFIGYIKSNKLFLGNIVTIVTV